MRRIFFSLLWIFFFKNPVFAAKCEGLEPERFPICQGSEIAIHGRDCKEMADPGGNRVCHAVSNLLSGKNCDSVSDADRRKDCVEITAGFESGGVFRNQRKNPVTGDFKKTIYEERRFWFSLGVYFALNRPSFIKKRVQNRIEEQLSKYPTHNWQRLGLTLAEIDQVKRWVKNSYPAALKLGPSYLNIQNWFEKLLAVKKALKIEKLVVPSKFTIRDMFSPQFEYFVSWEDHPVIILNRNFGLKMIDEGGNKIIRLGLDTVSEKLKAIVFPNEERNLDFLHGFRIQTALQGKAGIATVEGDFEKDSAKLGMMEFYPWDLKTWLEEMKLYDSWEDASLEEVAVSWGLQIVEGLEATHAFKFLHRDLKLANFLTDGENAVITDFDSSFDLEESVREKFLPPQYDQNAMLTTLCYLSPEYARTGNHRLVSSEVWSLGFAFYIFSTGRKLGLFWPDNEEENFPEWISTITKFEDLDSVFILNHTPFSEFPSTPFRDLAKEMMELDSEKRVSLENVRTRLVDMKKMIDARPRFEFPLKFIP